MLGFHYENELLAARFAIEQRENYRSMIFLHGLIDFAQFGRTGYESGGS